MEGGRTELELNIEKVKKVLEVIGEALDLTEPAVGAYMAATQIKPDLLWPHAGFMGFVSNRRALDLGVSAGVPGQPNTLAVSISTPNNPVPGVIDGGIPVTLSAMVAGGTPPYAYFWNFGDGQTSEAPSPVHTYPVGILVTYHVTLTVSDVHGATGGAAMDLTAIL